MVTLGNDDYTYEVSGENWGQLPEGWFYKEATSVDVDSKDNVCMLPLVSAPAGYVSVGVTGQHFIRWGTQAVNEDRL